MSVQNPNIQSKIISGALFDFAAFLTTRPTVTPFGSTENAAPALELLTEFSKLRGLSLDTPDVEGWQTAIPHAYNEFSAKTSTEISELVLSEEAERELYVILREELLVVEEDMPPRMTGCDAALIGVGSRCGFPDVWVYDYIRLVHVFVTQGMSEEDAIEWADFNIHGAHVGPETPVILTKGPFLPAHVDDE